MKKIIDEENISTETRITSSLFVNASSDLATSTSSCNDTDESFHSAVDENDTQPLIGCMDITAETKGNRRSFRRALGCINNHLNETPKTDMRRKLWRNMEEERAKKGGTKGIENTPPFRDITASAPPKLYRQRK